PYPSIADFLVRESFGDLMSHRLNTHQGNLVFGDTFANCLADCFATDIADTGAVFDDFNFCGGFIHALVHGGLGNIQQLSSWESTLHSPALHGRKTIVFNDKSLRSNNGTIKLFLKAKVEVIANSVNGNDVVTIVRKP